MGRPLGSKNKPKTNNIYNALQDTQEALGRTKILNRHSDTPRINTPVVTVEDIGSIMQQTPTVRFRGIYLHSSAAIRKIEKDTGLVNGGFFGDDHGCLIPVFFKAERTQDEMMEKVVRIHRGR